MLALTWRSEINFIHICIELKKIHIKYKLYAVHIMILQL